MLRSEARKEATNKKEKEKEKIREGEIVFDQVLPAASTKKLMFRDNFSSLIVEGGTCWFEGYQDIDLDLPGPS